MSGLVGARSVASTQSAPSFHAIFRVAGWWLLAWLCFVPLVTALPFLYETGNDDALLDVVNALSPMMLGGAVAIAAFQTVRRFPAAVWTAYVAFLAQTALFFGLGPLVYVFGDAQTIAELSATRLAITNSELLRTNLLVDVGVLAATLGLALYAIFGRRDSKSRHRLADGQVSLPAVAIAFLSLGGILRYALLLPYEFGVFEFVVPGFITGLADLFALGLAVAGYLSVKRGGTWRFLFWCLLVPNLLVAVLQFSKTTAMINLLVPALGLYIAHRRLSRLLPWLLAAALLFAAMQPLVGYGRNVITSTTGEIGRASLPQRFAIMKDFMAGGTSNAPVAGMSQPAWTRLAYSGPQAYAMALHDSGISGTSLRNAWMIFIPRLIWPGKPVGIGPGEDYYETVTGRRGSFLGLSVYGDAYWQAGWLGAVIFPLLMGVLFGWLSRNTMRWVFAGALIYLPLILLAFETGFLGPTKFLINGVIGPLPIYLAYLVFSRIWLRLPVFRRFRVRAHD